MLARIQELFVLGGPVESAAIGGLAGFLAGSLVTLFNLGVTRIQSAVAMVFLFVVWFVLLTAGLNAVREKRATGEA